MRLDVALVQRGLVPSRERAQEAIRAGVVLLGGHPVTRSATPVTETDHLQVVSDPIGFVGRGGLKLAAALDRFGLDPSGQICLDVGASTGGFTDCLLQRGARRVYAVDVGRGQLHPSLRSDDRVVSIEETDIRGVAALPETPAFAGVDVSFISLTLVLPAVARLVAAGGSIVALIKPQFEVGPGNVGKGGIVRDPRQHGLAVQRVAAAGRDLGLLPGVIVPSPVKGTEGNQEFLTVFRIPAQD